MGDSVSEEETCEICGVKGAGYITLIEGARMNCCESCAQGGRILSKPREFRPAKTTQVEKEAAIEIEITDDYAARIKSAREKMKIGRDVLAELIGEKENYIERVEGGKTLPNEELARKLEKTLKIKLFETVKEEKLIPAQKAKAGGITLGDIVFVKKKK